MPPLCTVEVAEVRDVTVVRLVGELDLSNVPAIETNLQRVLGDRARAVVDLTALDYVDSSGLGMLERLARRLTLRLVVPEGAIIARTLRVTGLDQLVPVFTSADAALDGDEPGS